jgi:NitT/TauT family transport system substrate-binding protein
MIRSHLEVRVPVRPHSRFALVATLMALAVALAGCSAAAERSPLTDPTPQAASPSTAPSGSPADPTATPEPVPLTVGLGFIPSVQFAPFYLADQAGYYQDAGLEVEFQNKIDPDLITLIGQGSIDLGLADGTSVIPAVSQGIPIRYVATIYGRFPSIVFSKASAGIAAPADLAGVKLGMPGRYGSSWIMLQALLESAGLSPDDLEIVEYPDFGQGAAVIAGAVDAATGFTNNEPVQLELTGEPATVLRVDDVVPLPGNGLIVGTSTLETKGDAVRAFIAATLRAMDDISANPEVGLEAAIEAVPELASARDTQAAILDATIDVWSGPVQTTRGLGAIEPADWQASIDYLTSLDLVPNPVTIADVIDARYLPAGD